MTTAIRDRVDGCATDAALGILLEFDPRRPFNLPWSKLCIRLTLSRSGSITKEVIRANSLFFRRT